MRILPDESPLAAICKVIECVIECKTSWASQHTNYQCRIRKVNISPHSLHTSARCTRRTALDSKNKQAQLQHKNVRKFRDGEDDETKIFCQLSLSTHINVANDDGVAVGVEEVFALRIAAEHDGLTASRSRQGGVDTFCNAERENECNECSGSSSMSFD